MARASEQGLPDAPRSLRRFAAPRFWPAWALVAWMRFSAVLPLSLALLLHKGFGRVLYRLARRQRKIVVRNLEICFPDLGPEEVVVLAKRHFEAIGMSFAECAVAWFASDRHVESRFRITGIEHLERALAKGKGVILYTGHFTTLELCGRPFKRLVPHFACMFSHRSNELLEAVQNRGRERIAHQAIPSHSVRVMLRALQANAVVWYAPDQAYALGRLVPFFGEPAMTNVATSKLARLSGAAIVPFSYRRVDGPRYELVFRSELEAIPSADLLADTQRLVSILERSIRRCPEQYQWIHRRFKGRPAPLPDLYAPPRETAVASSARQVRTRAPVPTDLRFSVVIPLNNEKANVRPLVTELREALAGFNAYELVLVDDGSTDGTSDEIRRVAHSDGPLRLLSHAERRGQSTAVYNGVRAADSEIVVVLDGDLQNDPVDIEVLLARYCAVEDPDRVGLYIGRRTQRCDSWTRRLSSRIANGIRSRVLRDDTPDTGCGLKLLKRSVFLQLPYFDHMHRFLPALVQRAGFRVLSVPVRHRPRIYGAAHYGTWDRAWAGIIDLAGVAWLARRNRPLDFREERM
jgi:dolichol-phosphate mannosyltransferase